jgi:ABC-type antimicrobial peptide transport system permease subunit
MHHKFYAFINLLGLASSLACVIVIARHVHGELTVDHFNSKLDRLFVSTAEFEGEATIFAGINNLNNEKDFIDLTAHPGVEAHAPFRVYDDEELLVDGRGYSARVVVADTTFLQLLDYPARAGLGNFSRPEDALLTEAFAERLFGDEDPLGKTFTYPGVYQTLTVAGVLATPPGRASLAFDVLVCTRLAHAWTRTSQSLVLLHPGSDYREVNRLHDRFIKLRIWGDRAMRYRLLPYKQVYFDRYTTSFSVFAHGNPTYVFVLSGIGALLLLVGMVNYLNIQSVVMTRRARELGMKKVFGAGGGRVLAQMLVENGIVVLFSLACAFALAGVVQPFMENMLDVRQLPSPRFDAWLTAGLLLALPLVASVPAFSRYRFFSPLHLSRVVNAGRSRSRARVIYLWLQHFMTIWLVVVSLFFMKQLRFMLDKDPGFRARDIIQVPFLKNTNTIHDFRPGEENARREKARAALDLLRQRLDASPLLEHWSFGTFPVGDRPGLFGFRVPGGEMQNTILGGVDETWFKLFDVRAVEGRLWDNATDNLFAYNLIVTESVLDRFGIKEWREALLEPSRRIWLTSGRAEEMSTNPPYRVVGVVKDMYVTHLSRSLEPMVFFFSKPHGDDPVIASFPADRRQEVLAFMKELHEELVGGEFTCSFIEDEIAALYKADRQVALLCTSFTGVAILVTLLGLLGVSLFEMRQRRKEIAIRKIHGARAREILLLLSRRYLALPLLAFLVAAPAALVVIRVYLERFAYRAPVSWWLFAVALGVSLLVSLLVLLYQVVRAGRENPARVLQTE